MEPLLTTDACTLPTTDRPLRLAEFDDLFATAVRRVERRRDAVRLHLVGDRGLGAAVRDLTLDVAVPPSRREILEALAARAQELSA